MDLGQIAQMCDSLGLSASRGSQRFVICEGHITLGWMISEYLAIETHGSVGIVLRRQFSGFFEFCLLTRINSLRLFDRLRVRCRINLLQLFQIRTGGIAVPSLLRIASH